MEAFETMRVLAFSRASRNFNCGTHIWFGDFMGLRLETVLTGASTA